MTPDAAVFIAELRAGRSSALTYLATTLDNYEGSVTAAAAELEVSPALLWKLGRQIPAVRAVLDAHAMGRTGAAGVASKARRRPVGKSDSGSE